MHCRDCQALLLDAAYGLLDDVQSAALTAHAQACTSCTTAIADTKRLQGLFATAAKLSFPEVKFETPKAEIAKPVEAPSKSRSYIPWAIAASVMIFGSVALAMLLQNRETPPVALIDPTQSVDPHNSRGLVEDGKNPKPTPPVVKSHAWTVPAPGEKPAYIVTITGNDALTLGVPNEYSILATKIVNKPAKVTFTVKLLNAKDEVLFEKVLTGPIVNLPVKDAAPKWLAVKAVDAAGVTTEWKTELPVVASAKP